MSLNIPNINSTNYLELSEIFSIIKSHVINEWQRNYDNDSKDRHYKCICPEVNTSIKFADMDRRKKVQISRLRFHSFIHSEDLYSASSRDYYSEALPAQPRTKKKD